MVTFSPDNFRKSGQWIAGCHQKKFIIKIIPKCDKKTSPTLFGHTL